MKKQLEIGDVFSLKTDKGNAYIQYVCTEFDKTDLIRVLPNFYEVELGSDDLYKLVNSEELFSIHFPLKFAYKKGIVNKVTNMSIPIQYKKPLFMREKTLRPNIKGWDIVDVATLKRHYVEKLSEEQVKLSPWGIWNDTLLIDRLVKGWNLSNW